MLLQVRKMLLLLPLLMLQLLARSCRLLRRLLLPPLLLLPLLLLPPLLQLSRPSSVPLLNSSACIRSTLTRLLGKQVISIGSIYCPSSYPWS